MAAHVLRCVGRPRVTVTPSKEDHVKIRRLLRLCEHQQVEFHSFKTYVPDTTVAVGTCTACGNQREVRLGFVAAATQERLIEVANKVLTQKGWVPDGSPSNNTWTRSE